MKPNAFKSIIKEAVKEAIQEELRDILLEAVRSSKIPNMDVPVGTGGYGVVNTTSAPPKSSADKRAMMESIMGDMRRGQDTLSFNSMDARGVGANTFNPQGAMPGGDLPAGNVGLDMIMGLMKGGK